MHQKAVTIVDTITEQFPRESGRAPPLFLHANGARSLQSYVFVLAQHSTPSLCAYRSPASTPSNRLFRRKVNSKTVSKRLLVSCVSPLASSGDPLVVFSHAIVACTALENASTQSSGGGGTSARVVNSANQVAINGSERSALVSSISSCERELFFFFLILPLNPPQ